MNHLLFSPINISTSTSTSTPSTHGLHSRTNFADSKCHQPRRRRRRRRQRKKERGKYVQSPRRLLMSLFLTLEQISTPPANVVSPASLTTLPSELLAEIMQNCENFKQVMALVSACKETHAAWITHASAIIWKVGNLEVLCFNDALMAVCLSTISGINS